MMLIMLKSAARTSRNCRWDYLKSVANKIKGYAHQGLRLAGT